MWGRGMPGAPFIPAASSPGWVGLNDTRTCTQCENPQTRIGLKSALSSLPLPATTTWPEGVWDKTVFSHGTMSVLVFTPRGRDYQTSHTWTISS